MSKKTLKRSLALGALMAFVITGSAWAETYEFGDIKANGVQDFATQTGFDSSCSSPKNYWSVFAPIENETDVDKVITTGDITYSGGPFGLYAAYFLEDKNNTSHPNPRLDNPNGNILEIKHNLTVTGGDAYLYGAGTGWGYDKDGIPSTAENNSVYVGGEDKQIIIEAEGNIYVGGAISVSSIDKHNLTGNTANVENVKFKSGEYVSIWGGLAQCGSADDNEAIVKDVIIGEGNIAQIIGGITTDESSNANNNTVNIEGNSKIAGEVYGGYSYNGTASNNTVNIKDTADISEADLYGDNDSADGTGNTLNFESSWTGAVGSVNNFDVINIDKDAVVAFNSVNGCSNSVVTVDGAILELRSSTELGTLNMKDDAKVVFGADGHLDVNKVNGTLVITEAGKTADDLNTNEQLTTVAEKLGVSKEAKETISAKVVMPAGAVKGETTGIVSYADEAVNGYYHGFVAKEDVVESINPTNASINNMLNVALMAWRAENNDMNKRLGELRNANGEHGVWVRMVNGESEYKNVENEYKTYQLGYDEKLSVDPSWTVGAAVSYTEGDSDSDKASGENKHKGFSIYGSKLNDDGSFVDLIAKVARIEHDFNVAGEKGDWDSNGYSFSAEYGKRLQQGNGLWIEPQVELTYGKISSAECELAGRTVTLEDMESLVGRVGFSLGKDIKQGNVYARASYLYDFEGETTTKFSNATDSRSFEQDLGGGWWEVGVGANINLSKATYIYADVEKTFGGEVDTNWQWNLGVRYSF